MEKTAFTDLIFQEKKTFSGFPRYTKRRPTKRTPFFIMLISGYYFHDPYKYIFYSALFTLSFSNET
ncbi:hypothetical protein AtDm6_0597 [Acetobacter tropicalis]|uniref:Uncharacterized protein n=1 Tax=Acetobacter tropicalis TaxID=104102 RepID=A0A094YVF9_9PROT|nr:hypothetical protein AtDm6_0597 [Acetobacter tropicalis]